MNKKPKTLKRICAFILAAAMVMSMFSTSVFAEGQGESNPQGFDPSDVFIVPFDENEGDGLGAPLDESGDDGYGNDGYGEEYECDECGKEECECEYGYGEEYECDECGKEECECE